MKETLRKPVVLALDTALGGCVVAVYDQNKNSYYESVLKTGRDQAARLVPMIENVLIDQAGLAFEQLGLIITTTGPGSFTGLRIGLSTAKSLALALNVPVQGVLTLEVMAQTAADEVALNIAVLLETKRRDFYVQFFTPEFKAMSAPFCACAQEVADRFEGGFLVCGDGVDRFREEAAQGLYNKNLVYKNVELLEPKILLNAGLKYHLNNNYEKKPLEAVYLREADVSVSNKIQREIFF